MAQVTITINSREYSIVCDEGEEIRILQLSRMMEEKAKMLTEGGAHINENMLLAMIGLLLADELSELKKTISSPDSANNNLQNSVASQTDVSQQYENLIAKITERLENYDERINSLAKAVKML